MDLSVRMCRGRSAVVGELPSGLPLRALKEEGTDKHDASAPEVLNSKP